VSTVPATVATQAVVLCGGRGTRLGASARTTPKVLHDVGGRPFLDRLLEWLGAHGLQRVHLCLGHLAAAIQVHLAAHTPAGTSVTTSVEDRARGTAGALRHAGVALDEVFLLLMGDTYLDVDLAAIATALPDRAEAMMVVTSQPSDVGPNVEATAGRVLRYDKAGIAGGWTDTGVAVVRRRVLNSLPDNGAPVDLPTLFGELASRGELAAHHTNVAFYDIGTVARVQRLAAVLEHPR